MIFIYFCQYLCNGILHKGYGYLSGNGRNYVSYCSLYRCFTDIGMGRIVDNSKPTKNGRIRPWILRMCGFVALASFMMYQSFW